MVRADRTQLRRYWEHATKLGADAGWAEQLLLDTTQEMLHVLPHPATRRQAVVAAELRLIHAFAHGWRLPPRPARVVAYQTLLERGEPFDSATIDQQGWVVVGRWGRHGVHSATMAS
jgi:hypothetical protein